mmetsp:Transcript_134091/g.347272  ORF Transcript_134091/g.347272 Transcript_134091/m.347272 type:complete len:168 (+) Transcript_134091:1905-2408(+)
MASQKRMRGGREAPDAAVAPAAAAADACPDADAICDGPLVAGPTSEDFPSLAAMLPGEGRRFCCLGLPPGGRTAAPRTRAAASFDEPHESVSSGNGKSPGGPCNGIAARAAVGGGGGVSPRPPPLQLPPPPLGETQDKTRGRGAILSVATAPERVGDDRGEPTNPQS